MTVAVRRPDRWIQAKPLARRAAATLTDVISLADAQHIVMAGCRALPVELVAFDAAIGLVLAHDVVSGESVPPFDNTAVDGYALRAASVAAADAAPVQLAVVGELAAGSAATIAVGPGEAVRIMTGAPIPPGADAVVMVEDTDRLDDGTAVSVRRSVRPGDAIRRAGSDVEIGGLVAIAGTAITPAVAGVLASVNARQVQVYRRAKVAVLSTGDELVDDGGPLAPGQIRESNRPMLAALLRQTGCDVVDVGVVADDEAELERVLRQVAAESDAIVTSGGVSMGDYDVVKAVLGRIAAMQWMQIAIRPAKPFAFGLLDGTPIFGLPGNPVSSFVSFEVLARPALRQMMGQRQPSRPVIRAIADEAIGRRPDGKLFLPRVVAEFQSDGRCHVAPVSAQLSHQLVATALANAIALVPDGDGIAAGADVDIIMLGPQV